ncbi:MAG: M3 family oligoendopeptidase [Planctomyces sp.]|nr:M3 family oligoendopeptidase [Planctomyces sp.]
MGKYELTWDLDALLPHPRSEQFRGLFDQYREELKATAEESDRLPPLSRQSVRQWEDFVPRLSRLLASSEDLHAFIGCHAAADAENKLYQQIEGQLAAVSPMRSQIFTNIEFALKSATDEEYAACLAKSAELRSLGFFLEECRRNAAFRLPRDQELLAADLAVDGLVAWSRLYDRISGSLRIEVMERGELVRKSPGQVTFDSPERTVRQNNFHSSLKAWEGIAETCADALNHISGTRLVKYRRLGVRDHLDLPLRCNRLQRETLESMWSSVAARRGCLKKYFARKAELLGVPRLAWYDLTAPLPRRPGESGELTYDTACDTIVSTFNAFSPHLGEFAQRAIRERWIEVENRAGKRQGGFCTGFPTRQQSRIFMTFTNSADSMSTLAHELGHAYHSYVLREEPYLLQDYPMNLAETASTFAEAVLAEHRLKTASSTTVKLALLDHMLSDAVAFLMNIHARFLFEDQLHRRRGEGELSVEDLNGLMLDAERSAYHDALDEDGWNPLFWASKLHFYIGGLPFYNFPYTFGYLLSQALVAIAPKFGDEFPERYRKLLVLTGCRETESAIRESLDYDTTGPDLWNVSLDVVEGRVSQFLELSDTLLKPNS